MSSRCPHNMVNFGPLTAEIGAGVWDTPANFNGFQVLAALLHSSQVVSVSQTLRREILLFKAKFHYAVWFGAGSKLVDPDSVMEFGFLPRDAMLARY